MNTYIKILFCTALFFFLGLRGSAQWVQQTTSVTQHLHGAMHFPSLPISIVVGTGGTILKTTNDGANWLSVSASSTFTFSDITYSGSNTAWICGNTVVLKSTNGGTNWVSQSVPNRFWHSIYMLNDNTGWVCGASDSVIKTTNGGTNWFVQENNLFPNESNNGIQFINSLQGYMVGSNNSTEGYILRTINGGANWAVIFQVPELLFSLYMVNSSTGYAGGNGKIYKTTNGGTNWASTSVAGAGVFYSVQFPLNADIGYATGPGKIIKTTNAGANWLAMDLPITATFRGLRFKNGSNSIGTVVGNSGTILWTTNGGGTFTGIEPVQTQAASSFSLSQNYPNPFNPVTNIQFSIPENEFVSLIVYDVTGKQAANLLSSELTAGTYRVDFDASSLSSGVYFYRITAGNFSSIKKMTLIK